MKPLHKVPEEYAHDPLRFQPGLLKAPHTHCNDFNPFGRALDRHAGSDAQFFFLTMLSQNSIK